MEKSAFSFDKKQFKNPQEEVEFLRGEIQKIEDQKNNFEANPDESLIRAYQKISAEKILKSENRLSPKEIGEVILDLSPEEHDEKINELIRIAEKRGIKNALTIIEKMDNPHLTDDFHRFLVQYLKSGMTLPGIKENSPIWQPTHMTLYEVALPEFDRDQANVELKKLVSGMEQFYTGLSMGVEKNESFSVEIAKSFGVEEFIFYVSVPSRLNKLFEKQITSLFKGVEIKEVKDDYNIFNPEGVSIGAFGRQSEKAILPIRTYDFFDNDPLSVLLGSFSKIDHSGEGASIQIVFRPASGENVRSWKKVLTEVEKGESLEKAFNDNKPGFWNGILKEVRSIIINSHKNEKDKKDQENSLKPVNRDDLLIDNIKGKISSPVMITNIRLIASSINYDGANEILNHLISAFNQFANTTGNSLRFVKAEKGRLRELLNFYSWRLINKKDNLLLNIKELATIFHFPTADLGSEFSLLKRVTSTTGSVPTGLSHLNFMGSTVLGINNGREGKREVSILAEDRLRHFYVIGQTGTGKTTLLKNMIIQDIKRGDGVCMIDPHGGDLDDILANIPKDRVQDIIYFDPARIDRPMGLNMLEFDPRFPEQKTFVVNEMLAIFEKLFDMKTAGGPIFEQYFRNSVLLTLEDPETGDTLLDVSRVLADKEYRALKLSHSKNPIVNQFWKEVAEKAGGEASLQNVVPYVTSKFDNFLSNEIMRPIISQSKSAFNFREIMDNKKILLVNLSKGRLGDLNSHLIGLIIVGKILMASLSRVGTRDLPAFNLYIDEFQNITTDSISVILSEARKYKLGLIIAHQFIDQLSDKIKSSVFGNVGTMVSFRVGTTDAELLVKQFEPIFSENDLVNLPNHQAFIRLLCQGFPRKPFSLETLKPEEGNRNIIQDLKDLSAFKFGRPRAEIEKEVMGRYQKIESI